MKRNQIILVIAIVALLALSAYYVAAVYLPAQQQAAQMQNTLDQQRGN